MKFEKKPEEQIENKEVFPEDLQELKEIACQVGEDSETRIMIGQPGGGSFFNPEQNSITFDPLQIEKNINDAKFIAAHEGSHRAITSGPKEMGFSNKQIQDYYSQVGFGYLQNVIEDPTVNNWLSKRFPRIGSYSEEIYDKILEKDNVVLGSSKEAQEFYIKNGYWPRYLQYGSEIIRDWHQKRFSDNLDPAVEKSLNRTIDIARESIDYMPNPLKKNERSEIIKLSKKRFDNNTKYIWPELKKLVEMDMHTEEQRQMLDDLMKEQKESKDNNQSQEDQGVDGGFSSERGGLKGGNSNTRLPEDLKKEIEKQIDTFSKEIKEKLDKNEEELEDTKKKQKELEEEIKELEEKVKNTTGKEKEDIEKEIENKKGEKKAEEKRGKGLEEENKNITDALSGESKDNPIPIDNLSKENRDRIEEIFNNLPDEKKKELREKAKEKLGKLEDDVNKEMEGKLNEDTIPSHEDLNKKLKEENSKKQTNSRTRKEFSSISESLKKIRMESMNPYEKQRLEVSDQIENLYQRLKKIFKPDDYGGDETGYSQGTSVDMSRAMQADNDFNQRNKMWIKSELPEKKDYRFWHLIDLSGSMEGSKIEETSKAFIIAAEAIDRIENFNSDNSTIHQGISGFNEDTFVFKDAKERFSKNVQDNLSNMTKMANGGTNTYKGTIEALEKIKEDCGENGNFILTFSDGAPNGDVQEELKELLKESKEERVKKNIKIGLIWLGESDDEDELRKLQEEYGYDFGLSMADIGSSKGGNKKLSFFEKLSNLLEDVILNPDKY
ncbi:MAG: hypothetical protein PHI45_03490 [Candidatus Pacebacteria bacterium]|nr:hypothetical protein [Candidatus Paceibacterota bacterium]MDD5013251.1 hypothetical protein [Candidatus Paceibacterota bacterium]MDD5753113.1 hypothetical protein [Candidatus Paceibacterota bacterium]